MFDRLYFKEEPQTKEASEEAQIPELEYSSLSGSINDLIAHSGRFGKSDEAAEEFAERLREISRGR